MMHKKRARTNFLFSEMFRPREGLFISNIDYRVANANWITKTPAEILADINDLLSRVGGK